MGRARKVGEGPLGPLFGGANLSGWAIADPAGLIGVAAVAVVVAILGEDTSGPDALDSYHRAWLALLGLSWSGAIAGTALRPGAPARHVADR